MGRTLPSATQSFLQEQEAFARFRRALRRADQLARDDRFAANPTVVQFLQPVLYSKRELSIFSIFRGS
jgi:hypothetical protein